MTKPCLPDMVRDDLINFNNGFGPLKTKRGGRFQREDGLSACNSLSEMVLQGFKSFSQLSDIKCLSHVVQTCPMRQKISVDKQARERRV